MQTTTKRPAGVDNGAPQEVCGPETTVAGTADNPWWESPALAYARGMQDGAQQALEEIAAVLLDILGRGRQDHDRAEPVEVLIRYRDQLAARGGRGWVK